MVELTDYGTVTDPLLGDPNREKIRILSIDGGGIYGLTSALWLRRLCEEREDFLDCDSINLLAGCSSGSINCLLMAKHENPREAVLSGELERFWTAQKAFMNSHPYSSYLSYFGLASWFHSDDFLAHLEEYFGDLTLGDLDHSVHVATYDWTGEAGDDRFSRAPRKNERNTSKDGFAFLSDLARPAWGSASRSGQRRSHGSPVLGGSRAGQSREHWKPKFFNNVCTDDCDYRTRVVDVAYAAAAPPGFRAIRGGFGDGAVFTANPSVSALALVVRIYRTIGQGVQSEGKVPSSIRMKKRDIEDIDWSPGDLANVLSRTALLSIGPGQKLPHYSTSDFNHGFLTFAMAPTNPDAGAWLPPNAYCLDPAANEAAFIVRELLSPSRTLRLNPGILELPVVLASYLARIPHLNKWIVDEIYRATRSQDSETAIAATLEFLDSEGWRADSVDEVPSAAAQAHQAATPEPAPPAPPAVNEAQLDLLEKAVIDVLAERRSSSDVADELHAASDEVDGWVQAYRDGGRPALARAWAD